MNDVVQYSPTEQALLDLLHADTVSEFDIPKLTTLIYKDKLRPYHAETVVRAAMTSLMHKTGLNREAFSVQRIKRVGKQPAIFRIVRSTRDKRLKLLKK